MMKPNPAPIRVAFTFAALALVALSAQAQTGANGRMLFKQKNCALCHFYEARSTAPSVKTMKAAMKGDPAKISAAISAAPSHANEIKAVSADEIKTMSEWLAAATFEEQAAAQAATPKPGSPEAKRAAAAKARQEAADKAKAAAEAKAQAKRDAEAKAKAAADAKAQAKKDAAAKALAGKDTAAAAKQEAEAKAQAARDAEAQAKRDAVAKQEKEALAKREADAKARKDPAALDAIKRENEERARRDAEAQATAKREAEAKAKREADALAAQKSEAEAKARKEAEAQAAKKPEPVVAKAEPAAKAEPGTPGGRKKIAYRDGSDLPPCPAPTGAPLGTVDEGGAKAVIERVGCPQCHAYVQKKTGPPMKQIHEKYKGDWECVVLRLTKNKTHKEEGVTDDLKASEVKLVSDYIATRNK
jgi:cytochrome c551/c552